MNSSDPNLRQSTFQPGTQSSPGEETLRLLATLPPPEGLTDRVHHKLRVHAAQPRPSFQTTWAKWTTMPRLQFAGAALVLVAAAGGGLILYQSNHAQPLAPVIHGTSPAGDFGSAKGMRVPPTLAPLHLPPAPRKSSSLQTKDGKSQGRSRTQPDSKLKTQPDEKTPQP